MECQVVYLMERFVANRTFVLFFTTMCQLMIFVISFLVEPFATELTYEGLIVGMDTNMSVQSGTSVKSFATNITSMRLV